MTTIDPKALEAAEDTLWHRTETGGRADLAGAIETFLEHPNADLVPHRRLAECQDMRNRLKAQATKNRNERDEARLRLQEMIVERDVLLDELIEAHREAEEERVCREEAKCIMVGQGKQVAALREALEVAAKTIHIWHDRHKARGMIKVECLWEIYQRSPEMKRINAALADTARSRCQPI